MDDPSFGRGRIDGALAADSSSRMLKERDSGFSIHNRIRMRYQSVNATH